MKAEKSNQLIFEKSPYLLQHAYNPVSWYPWGPQAFAKAQKENKPIFLSIGYSTCHWCHVMEHESFSDEETAKILNEFFVAIKVDREERPDIDSIYMSFVTATTGSGGWPLSVFLTPQQKPFYGGTYYPPQPRWGSPSFRDLLWSIHNSWTKQEEKARASGDEIVKAFFEKVNLKVASEIPLQPQILIKAYEQLEQNFDTQNGGFGRSPKFPMGHTLSFLLRYWKNNGEKNALSIVEKTLLSMAQGGINDQIGGGFHRYATDECWQVPHFEKMLYDQALLAKIYLEAFTATGNTVFADTARQILDYVLRDLYDSQGGFFCAEDADSVEQDAADDSHKKEGAFYIWSQGQLASLFESEEMAVINYYFGIEQNGNAILDPLGEFVGKNILHVKNSLEQTALYTKKSLTEVTNIVNQAKKTLFTNRLKRSRPYLDDKILTDWNGLMISSFALAGAVLQEPRYLAAAEKAVKFILENLRRTDGRLLHRYREGQAGILATLEDYAFFVAALLDLYESSFDPQYFKEALRLNQEMISLFWDANNGGFFLTPHDGEELVFRPKEVYDGAVPSGNSMAAHNLLRLYHFTFDAEYLHKAEAVFKTFYAELSLHPSGYTQMMMALQFYFGPVKEIVVAGEIKKQQGLELLDMIQRTWFAQKVLIVKTEMTKTLVEHFMPFTKLQQSPADATCVYICENQVCRTPIKDIKDLHKILNQVRYNPK